MRAFFARLLILFVILGFAATPSLVLAHAEIQRANAALVEARPLEAAADYEHAALILFWRADLREHAGRAFFAGGDMLNAVRLLSQTDSLSVAGWHTLGEAYFQQGLYEEAVRAYQRGLDAHGADASLYRGLALARNAQGNFEAEAAALQNYVVLDDTDAAVRHRLGLVLSIFDPDRALRELLASAQLDEEYASEMETMRSAFNLASIASNEADRLIAIGRGLGLVREWQLAREAFRRATLADGRNAEAWAWLGEADQHLGQDGSEELERAVALNPFSANVRALYGLYWKRQNEPQKALAQFQWAAAIEPQNPAFLAALAEAFVFAGDLPSALAAYLRAAELAPTDVSYWRMLALFSAQYSFQVEEVGIPAAQQVLALAPDEAASYDLLGWLYLAANITGLAEGNLQAALRLDPAYVPAHLHLGMTYLEMNRLEEARLHLIQAQRLAPESAEGQQAARLLQLYFP